MLRTGKRTWLPAFVLLLWTVVGAAAEPSSDKPAYPFELTPVEIVSLLCQSHLATEAALSEADRRLLADAEDGTLEHLSFDEAVLIASGVTDADARGRYLARLDRLEADARRALAGAEAKDERGDRLLAFLHEHALAGGYDFNQCDLHVTLDTGKFNCVSSAALFNLLAARLGHDVRAVEIPKHVFSRLYDGARWVDVETTNKQGFKPSRDAGEPAKTDKPDQPPPLPERYAGQRREVGWLGLTASIYFNHGVACADRERYGDAVIASFAAVGLDSGSKPAARNAIAFLNNWALALLADHQFETALRVVSIGLRAAPGDANLAHNHKAIWQQYATSEMQTGREDEAIAVLRRAAADVPDGDFVVMQAYLFERQAESLIGAGNLEAAVAIVERGMAKIDEPAQDHLRQWRAARVHNHILQEMQAKLRAGQYEAALAAIARSAQWLDSEDTVRSFQREVYNTWAWNLARDKNWQAAVDVYAAALRELPTDKALSHNAVACYDRWARSHMQTKNWQAAIRVYQQALEQFPEDNQLTKNLNDCKRRAAQADEQNG